MAACECGTKTSVRCVWPVYRAVRTRIEELPNLVDATVLIARWNVAPHLIKRNAKTKPFFSKFGPSWCVRCTLVSAVIEGGPMEAKYLVYVVRLPVTGHLGKFQKPLGYGNYYVPVEKLTPCGVPCCELHRREPGEKVAYCMTHWKSESDVPIN